VVVRDATDACVASERTTQSREPKFGFKNTVFGLKFRVREVVSVCRYWFFGLSITVITSHTVTHDWLPSVRFQSRLWLVYTVSENS
jgi:hypothetical protein